MYGCAGSDAIKLRNHLPRDTYLLPVPKEKSSMSLELQRQALEEIEVLEQSAAQRFRKNPALGPLAHIDPIDPVFSSSKKRPHKETILQQHELKYFGEQLERVKTRAQTVFQAETIGENVNRLQDPNYKFTGFENQLKKLAAKHKNSTDNGNLDLDTVAHSSVSSLAQLYKIYLSASGEDVKDGKYKRRQFLSTATAHLKDQIAQEFNDVEMYGRFLDLSLYYEMYKRAVLSVESHSEYLRHVKEMPNLRNSEEYYKYVESLLKYLQRFHANAHPLDPLPAAKTETIEKVEDGQPNEKGEVFCAACNKLFSKESVYKGHLDGKKHKKNAQSATLVDTQATQKVSVKDMENQVKALFSALETELAATIDDQERRAGLSDREMMLETLAVHREESDFTSAETDSEREEEDNDDEFFSKDLPLGADGTPIPLWLFKLQGLHRTYTCEICGNAIYKGRQQYTRHFSQPKHIYGLKCLGVPEEDIWSFSHISELEEAQNLWDQMKKSRQDLQLDAENMVEVEDDDGNVMSHKDYMELKRQGLI